MSQPTPYRIKSIPEFLQLRGLPKSAHPLLTVIRMEDIQHIPNYSTQPAIFDFYMISLKRVADISYKYGQQEYDFDDGVMFFIAPGQILGMSIGSNPVRPSGWILLIHPDFFWGTSLAKTIRNYEFFDYSVKEALFLSEKEEQTLTGVVENIEQEYRANMDKFSQDIIISQIETLLRYSERFYNRQFLTRKISNHQLLERLEDYFSRYFANENVLERGLPSVQSIADELAVTPKYLSSMLKVLTGQTTQQLIHEKVIGLAKQQLSTTDLSVSQIAFSLGFEHPQSFSKFFKSKTNTSPLEFRQSFN